MGWIKQHFDCSNRGILEAVGEGDKWPVRVVGLTDRLPASKRHYLARNVEPDYYKKPSEVGHGASKEFITVHFG